MACNCRLCDKRIDGFNGEMVMLKDELWLSIAEKKDVLCSSCIENKLGRLITSKDFKPSSLSNGLGIIPCNYIFMEKRKMIDA